MSFSRIFETATEIVGGIQIILSPLLIAGIIGWFVYLSIPGFMGIILAVIVILAGLILGIIWAVKAYKGKGTVHLVSRTMASPELDEKKEE